MRAGSVAGSVRSRTVDGSPFARPLVGRAVIDKSSLIWKDFMHGVLKRKSLIDRLKAAANEPTTPAPMLRRILLEIRQLSLRIIEDGLEIEYRGQLAEQQQGSATSKRKKTGGGSVAHGAPLPPISSYLTMDEKEDVLSLAEMIADLDELFHFPSIRQMLPAEFPATRNPFLLGKSVDELADLVAPHPEAGNTDEELKVLELLRYKRASRALLRAEAQVLNKLPLDLQDLERILHHMTDDPNIEKLVRCVCTLLDNDHNEFAGEPDWNSLSDPLFTIEAHELMNRMNAFRGDQPMRVDVQAAIRQTLRDANLEVLEDASAIYFIEWINSVLSRTLSRVARNMSPGRRGRLQGSGTLDFGAGVGLGLDNPSERVLMSRSANSPFAVNRGRSSLAAFPQQGGGRAGPSLRTPSQEMDIRPLSRQNLTEHQRSYDYEEMASVVERQLNTDITREDIYVEKIPRVKMRAYSPPAPPGHAGGGGEGYGSYEEQMAAEMEREHQYRIDSRGGGGGGGRSPSPSKSGGFDRDPWRPPGAIDRNVSSRGGFRGGERRIATPNNQNSGSSSNKAGAERNTVQQQMRMTGPPPGSPIGGSPTPMTTFVPMLGKKKKADGSHDVDNESVTSIDQDSVASSQTRKSRKSRLRTEVVKILKQLGLSTKKSRSNAGALGALGGIGGGGGDGDISDDDEENNPNLKTLSSVRYQVAKMQQELLRRNVLDPRQYSVKSVDVIAMEEKGLTVVPATDKIHGDNGGGSPSRVDSNNHYRGGVGAGWQIGGGREEEEAEVLIFTRDMDLTAMVKAEAAPSSSSSRAPYRLNQDGKSDNNSNKNKNTNTYDGEGEDEGEGEDAAVVEAGDHYSLDIFLDVPHERLNGKIHRLVPLDPDDIAERFSSASRKQKASLRTKELVAYMPVSKLIFNRLTEELFNMLLTKNEEIRNKLVRGLYDQLVHFSKRYLDPTHPQFDIGVLYQRNGQPTAPRKVLVTANRVLFQSVSTVMGVVIDLVIVRNDECTGLLVICTPLSELVVGEASPGPVTISLADSELRVLLVNQHGLLAMCFERWSAMEMVAKWLSTRVRIRKVRTSELATQRAAMDQARELVESGMNGGGGEGVRAGYGAATAGDMFDGVEDAFFDAGSIASDVTFGTANLHQNQQQFNQQQQNQQQPHQQQQPQPQLMPHPPERNSSTPGPTALIAKAAHGGVPGTPFDGTFGGSLPPSRQAQMSQTMTEIRSNKKNLWVLDAQVDRRVEISNSILLQWRSRNVPSIVGISVKLRAWQDLEILRLGITVTLPSRALFKQRGGGKRGPKRRGGAKRGGGRRRGGGAIDGNYSKGAKGSAAAAIKLGLNSDDEKEEEEEESEEEDEEDEGEYDEDEEDDVENSPKEIYLEYRLTGKELLIFGSADSTENKSIALSSNGVESAAAGGDREREKHPETFIWNILSRLKVDFKGSKRAPFKAACRITEPRNWEVRYNRKLVREVKTISQAAVVLTVSAIGCELLVEGEPVDNSIYKQVGSKLISEQELQDTVLTEGWARSLLDCTKRRDLALVMLDQLKVIENRAGFGNAGGVPTIVPRPRTATGDGEGEEDEADVDSILAAENLARKRNKYRLELSSFPETRMLKVLLQMNTYEKPLALGSVEVSNHFTLCDLRALIKRELEMEEIPRNFRFMYKGSVCAVRQEPFRRAWECLPQCFIMPKLIIDVNDKEATSIAAAMKAAQEAQRKKSEAAALARKKAKEKSEKLKKGQRRVSGRLVPIPIQTLCRVEENAGVVYLLHDSRNLLKPGDVIRIGNVLGRDYIIAEMSKNEINTNPKTLKIEPVYDLLEEEDFDEPIMSNFAWPRKGGGSGRAGYLQGHTRLLPYPEDIGYSYILPEEEEEEEEGKGGARGGVRGVVSADSSPLRRVSVERGGGGVVHASVSASGSAAPKLGDLKNKVQFSASYKSAVSSISDGAGENVGLDGTAVGFGVGAVMNANAAGSGAMLLRRQSAVGVTAKTTSSPTAFGYKNNNSNTNRRKSNNQVFFDCWIWICVPPREDKRPKWRKLYDDGLVKYSYSLAYSEAYEQHFRVKAMHNYLEVLCTPSRCRTLSFHHQSVNEMSNIPIEFYMQIAFDRMTDWTPQYKKGIERSKFIKLMRDINAFPDLKRPARVAQLDMIFMQEAKGEFGIVQKFVTYLGFCHLIQMVSLLRFPYRKPKKADKEGAGVGDGAPVPAGNGADGDDAASIAESLYNSDEEGSVDGGGKGDKNGKNGKGNAGNIGGGGYTKGKYSALLNQSNNNNAPGNKSTLTSTNTRTDKRAAAAAKAIEEATASADPAHTAFAYQKFVVDYVMLYGDWYDTAWDEAKMAAMKKEAIPYCAATRIQAKFRGGYQHFEYQKFLRNHIILQANIRRKLSAIKTRAYYLSLVEDWVFRERYYSAMILQSLIRRFLKRCWYGKVMEKVKLQQVAIQKARRFKLKKMKKLKKKGLIYKEAKRVNGVMVFIRVVRKDARNYTRDYGINIEVYTPQSQTNNVFLVEEPDLRTYMQMELELPALTVGELLDKRNLQKVVASRLMIYKPNFKHALPQVLFSKHGLGVRGEKTLTRGKIILGELFVCKVFETGDDFTVQCYHRLTCKVFKCNIEVSEVHELLREEHKVNAKDEIERQKDPEVLKPENKPKLYTWLLDHLTIDTRKGKFQVVFASQLFKSRKMEMIIKIQSMWRRALNRPKIIAMLDAFMLKVKVDTYDETVYYVNRNTGASSWEKPSLLGEWDLPTQPTRRWVPVLYDYDGEVQTHFVNPFTGKYTQYTPDQAVRKLQALARNFLLKPISMPRTEFVKAATIFKNAKREYEGGSGGDGARGHNSGSGSTNLGVSGAVSGGGGGGIGMRKLKAVINYALVNHVILLDEAFAKTLYAESVDLSEANPLVTRSFAFYLLGTCEKPLKVNRDRASILLGDGARRDPGHTKFQVAYYLFKLGALRQPKDVRALLNLALVQCMLYEENYNAEKLFRRALALEPFNERVLSIWEFVRERFPERQLIYNPISRVNRVVANAHGSKKRVLHGRPVVEDSTWAGWCYVPEDSFGTSKQFKGVPYWYNPADGTELQEPPDFKQEWVVRRNRSEFVVDESGLEQYFDPLTAVYFQYHPLTDSFQ